MDHSQMMVAKKLTDRQREIMDFIVGRIFDSLVTPTVREVNNHFGWKSTNACSSHFKTLERKGYLHREKYSRGVFVTKKTRDEYGLWFVGKDDERYL